MFFNWLSAPRTIDGWRPSPVIGPFVAVAARFGQG